MGDAATAYDAIERIRAGRRISFSDQMDLLDALDTLWWWMSEEERDERAKPEDTDG